MGLFFGLEQRLFFAVFGVALRVLHDAERLFLGPSDGFGGDPLAVGDPIGENGCGGHSRDGEVDDVNQV